MPKFWAVRTKEQGKSGEKPAVKKEPVVKPEEKKESAVKPVVKKEPAEKKANQPDLFPQHLLIH